MAPKHQPARERAGQTIQIRVSSEQKARMNRAAERKGLGLSGWLRLVALDAAEVSEAAEAEAAHRKRSGVGPAF